MVRLSSRLAGVLFASFALTPLAFASDPPDRSRLSYDENVIINTACFAASQQGASAYDRCIRAQLAALQAHPSPDRTALDAVRNAQIERACSYPRRIGIAEYNDCVTKAMAAPAPIAKTETDIYAPNIAKIFVDGPDRPQKSDNATTVLPLPSAVLASRPAHIDHEALSPAEVFKKVERSVFIVYAAATLADAKARNMAQGSAVAVDQHLLLTNCHVVKDRPVIRIVREQNPITATLVAADQKADRCILKSDGPPLAAVGGVRDFKDIAVGEHVFAIGTPIGLDLTLTQGLVSGLRNMGGRNLVQTDAPISHGNSGGGLFDDSGNLIGITTMTLAVRAGYQNLNFAVAASDFWEQR
jgi:hypothetical protein